MGIFKHIDITNNKEKDKFINILNTSYSKAEVCRIYGGKDTPVNISELNELAKIVGFDFNIFIQKRYPDRFCKLCGKKLLRGQKSFCCSSHAATYNNKVRGQKLKNETKQAKCIICGKIIEIPAYCNTKKCKCDNCKSHKRPHHKEAKTILDYSKRTVANILKRAHVGCSICGWNESSCDIHHIIPRSNGGKDEMSNLIIVCPNCHRICHTTQKYSKEYLQKLSMDKVFSNWKDFYHKSN